MLLVHAIVNGARAPADTPAGRGRPSTYRSSAHLPLDDRLAYLRDVVDSTPANKAANSRAFAYHYRGMPMIVPDTINELAEYGVCANSPLASVGLVYDAAESLLVRLAAAKAALRLYY